MNAQTLAHIKEHAKDMYPRECCGLIVIRKGKERYVPCINTATASETFIIDAAEYARTEDESDIIAIVHSHPNQSPLPSQADLVSCEVSGLPWVIMSWPTGQVNEIQPTGYVAPLIGRVFSHGVLDCYAIIRDYYREECAITLPNFARHDDWWKQAGQDLYRDNFEKAGFFSIPFDTLHTHDVILMQLSANVTNHGAIYLGDGKILHHPMNRLSGRDVFGGYWKNIATAYLRHKEMRT